MLSLEYPLSCEMRNLGEGEGERGREREGERYKEYDVKMANYAHINGLFSSIHTESTQHVTMPSTLPSWYMHVL